MRNDSNCSSPSEVICEVCEEVTPEEYTVQDSIEYDGRDVAVCVGCVPTWNVMVNDSLETMLEW